MSFLKWLEQTDLAQFLASDPYAYPIVLCFHAIGMAAAVGILWVLCLSAMGLVVRLPDRAVPKLSRVALGGFLVNAVSGLLLFTIDASRLIVNPPFLLKMGAIVIGGLAAWFLVRSARTAPEATDSAAPKGSTKLLVAAAVTGGVMGLVAVVFGRLIAYTLAPPF